MSQGTFSVELLRECRSWGVLGTTNYLVGRIRLEIAHVMSSVGRLNEEAVSFLYQAMQAMLGLRHGEVYVGELMIQLARVYFSQERYNEAEELYSDMLQNYLRPYPLEDLRRLQITACLAGCYWRQGKLSIAEEWFLHLIKAHMKLHGVEHIVTLADMGL